MMSETRNQLIRENLYVFFTYTYKKHGKKIPKMGPDAQVIHDMETDVNMPFVLQRDRDGMLDMVAKTVMRKKDFKTSNQKLKV